MRPCPCVISVRRHGLGAVEHALEVDRDHQVKIGLAHLAGHLPVFDLDQLGVAGDARVVDQDVDFAEALGHRRCCRLDLGLHGNVDPEERGLPTGGRDLCDHGLPGFRGRIPHGDRRPGAGKQQRRRPPNAVRAAGDNRHAVG